MAEAAVEERPTNSRFFCHKCSVAFDHVSSEYTCPHCSCGFIEELLENNSENTDEVIEVDDDDDEEYNGAPWMNALLMDLVPRASSRARFVHDPSRRRRYATTQPRYRIGRPRSASNRNPDHRQHVRFDNVVQDLIMNLAVGWGGGGGGGMNQVAGNMLFLGNPGDYAWGREGLDAIVTQLLNQMDGTEPPPLSKEMIQAIPTVTINQEQVDAKVQCSVCWEDFVLNENVRKLPCQHVYHENCICPWLELHDTCPICRQNLTPPDENAASNSDGRNSTNNIAANYETFQNILQSMPNVSANRYFNVIPDDSASSSGSSTNSTNSSSSSSSSTSTNSNNNGDTSSSQH